LLQQIFISLTLPQNINVIKNDGEEANSHYPPLTPPTSNIPSSSYSQQPIKASFGKGDFGGALL
jgi:hypothetical protein